MSIGFDPDVINPGGVDYIEVNSLVNPPNTANAGKVIGIGEDGKAALVEGGGGGGGGAEPVYLYVLDHPVESDDTLPPIPEEYAGYHWEISEFFMGVSLTENGTALKFAELLEIVKSGSPLIGVSSGDIGQKFGNVYSFEYAENVYQYNDEEQPHVCVVLNGNSFSDAGISANLVPNA